MHSPYCVYTCTWLHKIRTFSYKFTHVISGWFFYMYMYVIYSFDIGLYIILYIMFTRIGLYIYTQYTICTHIRRILCFGQHLSVHCKVDLQAALVPKRPARKTECDTQWGSRLLQLLWAASHARRCCSVGNSAIRIITLTTTSNNRACLSSASKSPSIHHSPLRHD